LSEIGWDQTSSLAKLDGTKRPVWQKWHGIKCPWDQLSGSPVKQPPASNDTLRVTTLKASPSRCRYKQVSLYIKKNNNNIHCIQGVHSNQIKIIFLQNPFIILITQFLGRHLGCHHEFLKTLEGAKPAPDEIL